MANVESVVERCEWPDGCENGKAPAAPTGGNPPRYCDQEVEGQRHDARERYRKFGRQSERTLPAALPEARPAEGLRAEMDRTQLVAEALLNALDQHGDAEVIEERVAAIEREAAARVQAADARATQALADNDQKIAAVKREMAVAEAGRGEALAEAAAARDANTQLEGEIVPSLEAAVAAAHEELETQRAAHAAALDEQRQAAAAELDSYRVKAEARVTGLEEQARKAKEAARHAEQATVEAKAATRAAEAVVGEQRDEISRLRDAHVFELARVREEHAADLAQGRAEADTRVSETRQEMARLTEAHTAELTRTQEQATVRLTERVEALTATHSAQLEARDIRIVAAERLASERAAERQRLEAEINLLGEQIRALNATAQRQAEAPQADEHPPQKPRRRATPTNE